ncbi:voltage-gated potassium channel [Catenulispora sp. MAP12-49]|uniref:potassium channel family protein n=1 Tax=unclassified Catenulispora TaxID=414885 RepID=UPI0035197E0B
MTARTGVAAPDQAAARPPGRRIVWTVLRVAVSIAAITTLYYLLPLDHAGTAVTVTMLLIGLVSFVALVGFQVRTIVRSRWPTLRAVEALAVSVSFFLLLFAASYVALANLSPTSFGQHLTHTDGLYFTVTVFSTVGFGDITAKTDTARLVVTMQMLTDLVIYGVAIKVFVRAVKRGRQRRSEDDE